jgi:phytoene dehydrogenase-like protein
MSMTKPAAKGVLRPGPTIEGGLDAIVLGDTAEGLAAAGLMAKGGLTVMVIERGPGAAARERREFAPGFFCDDGDPIAAALDAGVVETLDLYRHGLSFARRRLETLVRFSDRAALIVSGDPSLAAEAAAAMSGADAEAFRAFLERAFDDARRFGPWFSGSDRAVVPPADDLSASLDQRLAGRFADARLEDHLRAEALLGAGVRPTEPYGWLALPHRFAGDAAGLQGGLAAIEGGERALLAALRRACQSLGVAFRQTDRIASAVVEWDRVEGLALDDGGQIRASVVVSAQGARESFLGLVSRARLDIEFANAAAQPGPRLGSVRVHLALGRAPEDDVIAAKPDRRFLLAPSAAEIHQAWRAALDGGVGEAPIAEAMIPSAIDASLAPAEGATVSMLLHPVGLGAADDAATMKALETAAMMSFDRIAPGAALDIDAVDFETIVPAAAPIAIAVERRRIFAELSGVDGLFFCGPEARLGARVSLSAGRRAAERALAYAREKRGGR